MNQRQKKVVLVSVVVIWTVGWFACGRGFGGGGDTAAVLQQVQAARQESAQVRQELAQLRADVTASIGQVQQRQSQSQGSSAAAVEVTSLRSELAVLQAQMQKIEAAVPATAMAPAEGTASGPPPVYTGTGNGSVPGQTMKGIRADFLAARLTDRRLEVDFQITNITNEDFPIKIHDRSSIHDTEGVEHQVVERFVGGVLNPSDSQLLPSGLPMKGTLYFDKMTPGTRVVPRFSLCINRFLHNCDEYVFRDIPITVQ